MTSHKLTPYLMLTAAMITVGSTIIASKLMAEMPIFIAASIRFAIASPVLVYLAWINGKRWPTLAAREWIILCLQAGLGSVGYSVLLMAGVSLTQASDASVIAGTLPAVAALLSMMVLRERLNGATVLAIGLATLGVCMLGFGHSTEAELGSHRWIGNALVMAAIACEAIFLLLNKTIKTAIDPLVVATVMSTLSLAFCAVPALFQFTHTVGPAITVKALAAAVYYALVPTVAGFFLWYKGASLVSGARASLFTAVYPTAGLLLSAGILGEVIGTQHWIGAGVTVLGILIGSGAALGCSKSAQRC